MSTWSIEPMSEVNANGFLDDLLGIDNLWGDRLISRSQIAATEEHSPLFSPVFTPSVELNVERETHLETAIPVGDRPAEVLRVAPVNPPTVLAAKAPIFAEQIAVLVVDDDGNGDFTTLAAAIAAANPGSHIQVTGGADNVQNEAGITVNKALTIQGDGNVTINAGGRNRVFTVDDGQGGRQINVTLDGLTITGGSVTARYLSYGGGVLNRENLTLTNSTVIGNSASAELDSGNGGGIFSEAGTLTLTNSTVSGNSATLGGGLQQGDSGAMVILNSTISNNTSSFKGGGIYNNRATVTLTNSTVSGNSSSFEGGGLFSEQGGMTLTNAAIANNSAGFGGGAMKLTYGNFSLSNSTVSGNVAQNRGGGIYQGGSSTLNILNTSIRNNYATDTGGGIYNEGTLNLTNSTISGNFARDGGGIYTEQNATLIDTTVQNNTASRDGGGILNDSIAAIINSTISGNLANRGGGIANAGFARVGIGNSTVSGNLANSDGGGIFNLQAGTLYLLNSTVANNTADRDGNGSGEGGGIATYSSNSFTSATLTNSIVADNLDNSNNAGAIAPDLAGEFIGNANNFIGNLNGSRGTIGSGSDRVGDPLLAPLADNGGATFTHALLPGSAAIDGGNNSLLLQDSADFDGDGNSTETIPFDQRGRERIVNGSADIGAFEFNPNATANGAIAEFGTLTLDDTPVTVNFVNQYVNPIVFAQPPSFNGSNPAIVRLDNIDSDSFRARIQEPNSEDGNHTNERVNYFVFEAGSYLLDDGTLLEVGTLNTNRTAATGFINVDLDNTFAQIPAIFSQVQTFNGSDFVRTRQRNATTNGFQLALEEEEALSNTPHASERVGYLAIDRGTGTWNGNPFQATVGSDRFTNEFSRINFSAEFDSTPQFLASLASYDGVDPAGLRYQNLNRNRVDIKVEEDQSLDAETTHTSEAVNFFAIDGNGDFSAEEVMGELGSITLDEQAVTIDLLHRYDNPVVFMQPPSFNGADEAIVRLDNITDNSFRARLQEANYKDGNHTNETVSYFVFEAGTYQLTDGTLIEVGTLETNRVASDGFVNVPFEQEFDSTPAVFSQVQTFNGSDFVRTRQRNTNANRFQLALEEEEALSDTAHATERVGYLAIESGTGTWSGNSYQVGSRDGFDDEFRNLNFSSIFNETPQFLGALATYNGSDPAGLRYQNLGTSDVEIKVEEDQSLDGEIAHATETVNFLAMSGSGLLGATVI